MRRYVSVYLLTPIILLAFFLNAYAILYTPLGLVDRSRQGHIIPLANAFKFYSVLPAILGFQNSSFFTGDDRPRVLEQFILKYYPQSPLLPYNYFLVETADRYNLHYTLLVAIAMQESHLCRNIPPNSNNCWGLGIYGDKIWRFVNYEEAITALGKTLSKYQSKGRVEPDEIMKLYTPSSDGTWARAVRHFMDEMQAMR